MFDRSGSVVACDANIVRSALKIKKHGNELHDHEFGSKAGFPSIMHRMSSRSVVIDATDSSDVIWMLIEAANLGARIVCANKCPASADCRNDTPAMVLLNRRAPLSGDVSRACSLSALSTRN
jgi:hypothetical protein